MRKREEKKEGELEYVREDGGRRGERQRFDFFYYLSSYF